MLDIEKLKGVYLEPLCDENYDLEDEETLVKEAIASLFYKFLDEILVIRHM